MSAHCVERHPAATQLVRRLKTCISYDTNFLSRNERAGEGRMRRVERSGLEDEERKQGPESRVEGGGDE